jgi:hypothetical protein
MKAEFKIGICFSNTDPKNLGRIRVVPIEILGKYATLNQILEYIKQEDLKAENGLLYRPWYTTKNGNYKEKDTFLCEPFLPKLISVTPNPGQLVKIIRYDDITQKTEFIGPYTIDQISLTEEYRNVINNLDKNLNLKQILPKKNKPFISGYNNEQIILGDNEIIIRLNHIDKTNKNRKSSYPFIQLSQFNDSYKIVDQVTQINNSPDVPIDHICELFIDYQPKSSPSNKNFTATLVLSNSTKITNSRNEIGLTKKTYQPNKNYIEKNTTNFITKHVIYCNNSNDLVRVIDDILVSYSADGSLKYYDINEQSNIQVIENEKTIITVFNNIPETPNAGGALNPSNIIPSLKNWIFRLTPNTNISNYEGSFTKPNLPENNIATIIYNDFIALDNLISTKYNNSISYGLLNNKNETTIVTTQPTPQSTDIPLSVQTTYSDKYLFLSSLRSLNIVDNFDFDGIPPYNISEFLNSSKQNVKTYGFVRGEKLMEFLFEMLDMLSKHGHEAGKDPRASIIQSTQESIDNLKKRIKDELKESQNNIIINHNFRTD